MIKFLLGDATKPQINSGLRVIAHVCNNRGGWGKGFVRAISNRWDLPENSYRMWYNNRKYNNFGLGSIQNVSVDLNTWVCNMIAQDGYASRHKPVAIKYDSLEECLVNLSESLSDLSDASIHMPRIGCGLAGGSWERVEGIINKCISAPVFVYDFKPKGN